MIDDADQTVAGCVLKLRKRVVANTRVHDISHRRCSGYLCRPDQDVPLEPDGVGFLLIHEKSLQLEDKHSAAKQREAGVRFPSTADSAKRGVDVTHRGRDSRDELRTDLLPSHHSHLNTTSSS